MAMMVRQMMRMVMSRGNGCRRCSKRRRSIGCYGSFLYSSAGT